ncbi:MAG: S-methyl-5-thioribose-1-phosphate isomerase [Candidatus Omnitrophica bacterium]|nr:S-methyl-5-thioribose-1-phosphate isomerase [Candidatus Omnitrophota bacterium]
MKVNGKEYRTVWLEGSTVKLIDQHKLPHAFEVATCRTHRDTAEAIRTMLVRGAGAIGASAGYAMAQAVLEAPEAAFASFLEQAASLIRATRPTAHDLFYAVEGVLQAIRHAKDPAQARQQAVRRAEQLADENANAGEAIGRVGAALLRDGVRVMTHCNAGWLAFVDWGSALAPIYHAHRQGRALSVYVNETRPRSQGAKLTAWELAQEGVAHTVIADTAAGSLFRHGQVDCVIVGADRIAANGDVVNKIGTYTLAVLAKHHGVPFYVAAPRSTFDVTLDDGSKIPIEERSPEEVTWVSGLTAQGRMERVRITPEGSAAKNPAFDMTPAELVASFITEGGVLPPSRDAIRAFVSAKRLPADSIVHHPA